MCNGFVLGGCVSLQKSRSLVGTRIQMPEGVMSIGSRSLECRHYCDINPGLSVGADFYFLHVESEIDHPLEAAVQAMRDLKIRPAGNGEAYSIAHQEDYKELHTATAAVSSKPRSVGSHHTEVNNICLLCLGGQMVSNGSKYNPLMVRQNVPLAVTVRGLFAPKVRWGWYIPVTDHRIGIWK